MSEGKIYQYQTGLRYRLETKQPISTINDGYIKWKKPPDDDGISVTGVWNATLDTAATANLGIVYVEFTGRPTAWNEAGPWKLWPYVNFIGGGSAPGEAVEETVYEEGE